MVNGRVASVGLERQTHTSGMFLFSLSLIQLVYPAVIIITEHF